MSPEILFMFLIFGVFGVVVVGLLLIGVALVVVFVWMIRRFTRVSQTVNEALQTETDEYFADIVPNLQPWHQEALADFSSRLEWAGRRIVWSIHYRGAIKSLEQSEETGWLAYELRLKLGKGPLVLRTSARTWQLDIQGSSARVTVEGKPLGRLHRQRREVTLFGVDDQPIGQYHRAPPGLWGWQNVADGLAFPAVEKVEAEGDAFGDQGGQQPEQGGDMVFATDRGGAGQVGSSFENSCDHAGAGGLRSVFDEDAHAVLVGLVDASGKIEPIKSLVED